MPTRLRDPLGSNHDRDDCEAIVDAGAGIDSTADHGPRPSAGPQHCLVRLIRAHRRSGLARGGWHGDILCFAQAAKDLAGWVVFNLGWFVVYGLSPALRWNGPARPA